MTDIVSQREREKRSVTRGLAEKWGEVETKLSEWVIDRVLTNTRSSIPSYDFSDVVRGHRVVTWQKLEDVPG